MASTETSGDAVAVAIHHNEEVSVQGAGMGQFSLLSCVSANSATSTCEAFWGVFTYCSGSAHILLVLPCGKYLQ